MRHRQNGPSQIVVSSVQAEELISKGYRFVGNLPNGKVVLEGNPSP